jgi:hypothetical protein
MLSNSFGMSLGMDQGTGTIGAKSLGAIHDKGRDCADDDKPRRCKEPGCGTILRSGNPDNFCFLHTAPKPRKGHRYTDGLARQRRKRLHLVKH